MSHSRHEVKGQERAHHLPGAHPLFQGSQIDEIMMSAGKMRATWLSWNGKRVDAHYQPPLHELSDLRKGQLPDIFPRTFHIEEALETRIGECMRTWLDSIGVDDGFVSDVGEFNLNIGHNTMSLKYLVSGVCFAAYCESLPRNAPPESWTARTQLHRRNGFHASETEIVIAGGEHEWLVQSMEEEPVIRTFSQQELEPQQKRLGLQWLNYKPAEHRFERIGK